MSDSLASEGLDDLAAELDQTFRAELADRIGRMRELLARLDRNRASDGEPTNTESEALDELSRHAHSIKGGAMLVGRQGIARLAGALEAWFPRQTAASASGAVSADVRAATELMARLGAMERATGSPGDDPSIAADVDRLVSALAEGERR